MVLGGGGTSAPLSELILQLLAAGLLAVWLIVQGVPSSQMPKRTVGLLMGVAILALLLPIIQLLPLPPQIWQGLPGRGLEQASLALVGRENVWMPWSMTPARTFASLLALLPPVALMAVTAMMDRCDSQRVMATVAGVTVLSVCVGALQLSSGPDSFWRFYGADNFGFLNGFQANRNAEADVLLIGIVATAAALHAMRGRLGHALARGGAAGVIALLALGCILTGSRAGIAMVPLALGAALAIWWPRAAPRKAVFAVLGAVVLSLSAAFLLLRHNPALVRVASRFGMGRDFRWELWEDTRFAIAAHWPFGSGIGSFRPVFMAAERLEVVDPSWPVRAHNDYLELALEGGAFGLALLMIGVVLLAVIACRAWQNRTAETRGLVITAAFILGVIALHSLVDYPIRSMALAHLAGLAVGLLIAGAVGRLAHEKRGRPRS